LNPWNTAEYGKIKIYTKPVNLIDTGLIVTPDLNWHTFEIAVDFAKQQYLYIMVDDHRVDLTGIDLAQVYHPDWGAKFLCPSPRIPKCLPATDLRECIRVDGTV